MATESASAPKGKRAGGKRGHPPATNDSIHGLKTEPVDTEDSDATMSPPMSKKRRNTTSINMDDAKEQKYSPASTSTVLNKSGGRGRNAQSSKGGRGAAAKGDATSLTTQPEANAKSLTNNKSELEDWSSEDLATLIENLIMLLPKSDNVKYSTQAEKLDWSKVCFSDHSAEECKDKWNGIITKLRRYRTLSELAFDAKEWVTHPWMVHSNSKGKPKHPGLPKKPLTPYFRFFSERREKCSRDNPTWSMTDIAKVLSKKFTELPDKKKQKYKDIYEKDMVIYRALIQKFREEHPDMFPEMETKSKYHQSKQNGPLKAQSALQLFLAEKMLKHVDEIGPPNKKEMEDKYRNQFKNLSGPKRVRWINKALADETRFAAELADYRLRHPEYNPDPKKSVISKAERELKDRIDGKPDRPPNSGYSLYSKIMLKELKEIPSKEKMSEISRRWKELSEKERQSYGKQAQDAITRYQQDLKVYMSNLSEDERKKLEEEDKKKRKKPLSASSLASAQSNMAAAQTGKPANNEQLSESTPSRPKKPMSALFFYQQEKMSQYKAKHSDRSEQELTRLIAREYGELSEKKKEKFKKMAEDAKKMYEQTASSKENEIKNKVIKSEPKKPPQSGYSLYTSELMSTLTNIEPRYRMAEISKRWNVISSPEKDKYKRRAADLTKKYQKELNKFLMTLTDEEKKIYQQLKVKKTRRTKAQQPVIKEEKAESSSSSDEESSKADNKESSSSDSGSGSDSDSSSESDDSGSGSDSDSKSEASGSDKEDSDDDDDDDNNTKKESANSSSDDSDDESDSGSASKSDSEEE